MLILDDSTSAVDTATDARIGVYKRQMETSVPDIYAVGDAVEVTHFVTGQKALISLAGPANKQGRIAAEDVYKRQEYTFFSILCVSCTYLWQKSDYRHAIHSYAT